MIEVLIADDQALVRAGLSALLDAHDDITVVGTAANGDEVVEQARNLRPDVVCMDIRMPGRDGISATRELCGPDSVDPIPVLILTTFDIDDLVFGALEAGASGFLLKDSEPETIADAVRAIAAGDAMLDQSLTRRVLSELVARRAAQPVVPGRSSELLTPRERDILLLLADGRSNDEIAEELFIGVATVKSHLARMMPKIGASSRLQAAVWAYQNRIVEVP